MIPNPIKRSLVYEHQLKERRTIDEDAIPEFPQPVIILGDPGLGKSVLTDTLGALPNMRKVRAGTFMRTARPETLIKAGERIIVDGLDEIASASPGGGVHAVLSKLSEMDYPPIILSCREADWRGAADRIQISDDYGADPVLLHLQPFGWDDALAFLANRFPALDPRQVLEHLAHRGLDGVYQNPLTLRLFAEVAHQQGLLPDSRAEILERACTVMLIEDNPRHHDSPHVHRNDEDLLLAAGAICAMQLLCDRSGVFTGPTALDPGRCRARVQRLKRSRSDKSPLMCSGPGCSRLRGSDSLRTSTVSWPSISVPDGLPAALPKVARREGSSVCAGQVTAFPRRSAGCMPGSGTSMLPSPIGASQPTRTGCSATAMLRPSASTQARALLEALKKLSRTDPYFASEDWGRHPASGLIRHDLKEEILAILTARQPNLHLFVLVTNAMVGTDLARDVAPAHSRHCCRS